MTDGIIRQSDYETIKKLFNEEYIRIVKLIQHGETHLDNLAEGFASADKVIWKCLYLGLLEQEENYSDKAE